MNECGIQEEKAERAMGMAIFLCLGLIIKALQKIWKCGIRYKCLELVYPCS